MTLAKEKALLARFDAGEMQSARRSKTLTPARLGQDCRFRRVPESRRLIDFTDLSNGAAPIL
jgi:hypothetical protein